MRCTVRVTFIRDFLPLRRDKAIMTVDDLLSDRHGRAFGVKRRIATQTVTVHKYMSFSNRY